MGTLEPSRSSDISPDTPISDISPPPSLGIPVMSSIEVVRGVIASRLALER